MKEIHNNIFHVDLPTQYDLTSTFLRFQEHYESPEFKGKIFTLEEYKKWYTANSPKGKQTGEFTYYEDWNGFNVPSHIFEPFFEGKFDPLDEKEKNLLDMVKPFRPKRFYVIGTHSNNVRVLTHEIAHGLFYTNDDYKKEVLLVLEKINADTRDQINGYLASSGGYNQDVWEDETHAYLIYGAEKLIKFGIDPEKLIEPSKRLEEIFKKSTDK